MTLNEPTKQAALEAYKKENNLVSLTDEQLIKAKLPSAETWLRACEWAIEYANDRAAQECDVLSNNQYKAGMDTLGMASSNCAEAIRALAKGEKG